MRSDRDPLFSIVDSWGFSELVDWSTLSIVFLKPFVILPSLPT